MNTKLTLNIDVETIRKAKLYAKNKGRSLSDIVENILKALISGDQPETELSTRVKSLAGSITLPEDFDYKKSLGDALSQKYLPND
jgi:hypothetical protein